MVAAVRPSPRKALSVKPIIAWASTFALTRVAFLAVTSGTAATIAAILAPVLSLASAVIVAVIQSHRQTPVRDLADALAQESRALADERARREEAEAEVARLQTRPRRHRDEA